MEIIIGLLIAVAVIAVVVGCVMLSKKERAAAKMCMVVALVCAFLALFAHCANQISEKTQYHHERKDF